MDFLFHKVNEKEKEDIKKQAQGILDDFSKQLSRVKSKPSESLIERSECEREEGGDCKCCEIDRDTMFENARDKNSNFIIAERKKW